MSPPPHMNLGDDSSWICSFDALLLACQTDRESRFHPSDTQPRGRSSVCWLGRIGTERRKPNKESSDEMCRNYRSGHKAPLVPTKRGREIPGGKKASLCYSV